MSKNSIDKPFQNCAYIGKLNIIKLYVTILRY
ncbi:hypothetical protein T4D_7867 [Trichinella pseudospiralis]|uniref:Uncharacterized protein n=1 Tax=Trichinella pseudospiralis TaxID=6337 RepID=A0A0V1D9R7_TRIPS|nr:hypothetical protein T4D_7867 [Trichinella pseudospiralis]